MTKTAGFRKVEEADCYIILHDQGVEALDAYTRFSSHLLNTWCDLGMVRISYPDGGLKVRTFKKWATTARKMQVDNSDNEG